MTPQCHWNVSDYHGRKAYQWNETTGSFGMVFLHIPAALVGTCFKRWYQNFSLFIFCIHCIKLSGDNWCFSWQRHDLRAVQTLNMPNQSLFTKENSTGIPEFLDSGCWTLVAGLWMLGSGCWTLDTKLSTLDSGHWTLDWGC